MSIEVMDVTFYIYSLCTAVYCLCMCFFKPIFCPFLNCNFSFYLHCYFHGVTINKWIPNTLAPTKSVSILTQACHHKFRTFATKPVLKVCIVSSSLHTAVNKCSFFVAMPTFNQCIWPHSNQTWHRPTTPPLTQRHTDCLRNLFFGVFLILLLMLFHSTDITFGQLSSNNHAPIKICRASKDVFQGCLAHMPTSYNSDWALLSWYYQH